MNKEDIEKSQRESKEIFKLARLAIEAVKDRFDIILETQDLETAQFTYCSLIAELELTIKFGVLKQLQKGIKPE